MLHYCWVRHNSHSHFEEVPAKDLGAGRKNLPLNASEKSRHMRSLFQYLSTFATSLYLTSCQSVV